jgi:hypothetical protein
VSGSKERQVPKGMEGWKSSIPFSQISQKGDIDDPED